LKQAFTPGMKLKSGPAAPLPRSKMKPMNATAALESKALKAKNSRSDRAEIKASVLMSADSAYRSLG
jgi:hypothetical protein